MDKLANLTLRTTTALGRLNALQRRAHKAPAVPSLVQDALEELSTALEELRTATENLTEQADEIAGIRRRAEQERQDFHALFTSLPIPCLFTDVNGRVLDANPQASRLLNVGRQHLVGKPLILFFTERDPLTAALELPGSEQFELRNILRPRERRPREVVVRGVRLPDLSRWCWFLENPPGLPEAPPD